MFYVKVYEWVVFGKHLKFLYQKDFSFDSEDEMYLFISDNIRKGLEFDVGVYE